ncbi:MAG: F0F1 ATP synthase subunit epsilon [Planctomycetes bacterium RBG_16_41_13]|nr:MAG: F0F1 ATP synthase subunit epsilon [Planctomycetes bacterium RBG_16_41_13]
MRLKVLLPTEIFINEEVEKVVAEADNGYFCLLPRHVDFVSALVPGLLIYEQEGREVFLAVDEGILVKCGAEVLVSTRNAVRGPDLGRLKETVENKFRSVDERKKIAHSAVAKLEINFVRQFIELGESRHG